MQQSRLLTQLSQQVTETNRHLNSIRNWVTFLGVVVALALIGSAIMIADTMGPT
jgi:flagellar hook assembly protein FlgD